MPRVARSTETEPSSPPNSEPCGLRSVLANRSVCGFSFDRFSLFWLSLAAEGRVELAGEAFAFEPVAIARGRFRYFVVFAGVEEGAFFWAEAGSFVFRSSGTTICFRSHSPRRFCSSVSGRGSGVMWRMPLPYITLDLPPPFAVVCDQDVNKAALRIFDLRRTQSERSRIARRNGSSELFG